MDTRASIHVHTSEHTHEASDARWCYGTSGCCDWCIPMKSMHIYERATLGGARLSLVLCCGDCGCKERVGVQSPNRNTVQSV